MTSGQYRVLMLLIVLAVLEVAAHPAVKAFFKTAYSTIGSGVAKK